VPSNLTCSGWTSNFSGCDRLVLPCAALSTVLVAFLALLPSIQPTGMLGRIAETAANISTVQQVYSSKMTATITILLISPSSCPALMCELVAKAVQPLRCMLHMQTEHLGLLSQWVMPRASCSRMKHALQRLSSLFYRLMHEASYVGTLTISSHQQFCHAVAGRSNSYHMHPWDL